MEGKFEYDLMFDWIKEKPKMIYTSKEISGISNKIAYKGPSPQDSKDYNEDKMDDKRKMENILNTDNAEKEKNLKISPHNVNMNTQDANFHANLEEDPKGDSKSPNEGGEKKSNDEKKGHHKKHSSGGKKDKCSIF